MSVSFPKECFDNELKTALSGTAADYYMPSGNNLISRLDSFYHWFQVRNNTDTWQYSRIMDSAPRTIIAARDSSDRPTIGLNFASQDYLGLSAHPAVLEAAKEALSEFGPHGAGSPVAMGHTSLTLELEEKLRELTGMEHILIFPTGWASGYGSIVGLVRKNDHIVMDRCSHSCLQHGALYAAKQNIHKFDHLDHENARAILKDIRAKDTKNAILVVTEGIFSMSSDTPDLPALQEICREYNATLLIDVAHDLGSMGPDGAGQPGIQGIKGKADLLIGSFSKSFAANGGFLATNSPAVKEYVKSYAGPYIFSNAISPVQAATAMKAATIIISQEGEKRRQQVAMISDLMRSEFEGKGRSCLGIATPVIPLMIGRESVARVVHGLLRERYIAAMISEFPVVPIQEARFHLQVMATHIPGEIITAVGIICEALEEAEQFILINN